MSSAERPAERPAEHPRPRSNLAKEREFYRYLPRDHAAFPFAPFDATSQRTFVATPSRDRALTSFAQLGALKLGAERAVISLVGPTHQYVIAEGLGSTGPDADNALELGCCILPKENGFCVDVADLPLAHPSDNPSIVEGSALVKTDIKEGENVKQPSLVNRILHARFCAGVPIIAPRGIAIGSYCVFDTRPRASGLDEDSIAFMKHMAATVMEYLDTLQLRYQNAQARKMIYGLGSFVEGRTTLRDSWLEADEQDAATARSGVTVEGQLNKRQQDLQETQTSLPFRPRRYSSRDVVEKAASTSKSPDPATPDNSNQPAVKHHEQDKVDHTQHSKAPSQTPFPAENPPGGSPPATFERVFSRAANLIRESLEVEGVVFLDARIGSFGGLVGYESRRAPEPRPGLEATSSEEGNDSSSGASVSSITAFPAPSRHDNSTTTCLTLGSSTSLSSTINNDTKPHLKSGNEYAVHESVLKAIVNRYPRGKIFNYTQNGSLSDDSSSATVSSHPTKPSTAHKRRRRQTDRQYASDLNRVLGGARSIIFMPMWDSHKSRWLSGVLVWTNTPERIFTAENELAFLHAFGNSITAELHRLDVEMAEKAKKNLATSISHELRSPLHGILGTADILSDTGMNALQQGMVHTLQSCGRTLLDTVNTLLDFTHIDKFTKDLKPNQQGADSERNTPGSSGSTHEDVQLDAILEEVVESIFAGHTFYHHPPAQYRNSNVAGGSRTAAVLSSKHVSVIFDIQEAVTWTLSTQPGCWRRILMNIFSNALKYTPNGYIYIGLKVAELPRGGSGDSVVPDIDRQYKVTLTVKDTGQGIGVEYLRNDLFTPFSQEDTLAPGSGLGLSIVRKALAFLHGSIDVNSEKDQGTEISIQVPLRAASTPDTSDGSAAAAYNSIRNQAQGKNIGLIGFGSSSLSERDAILCRSLTRLCEDWFHLTVRMVSVTSDTTPCDFYLMIHTDLDGADVEVNQLLNTDQPSKLSPLIFVCQSPEAAHSIFTCSMNTTQSQVSVVEFISQPCGPRKLAKTLELCMQRLGDCQASKNSGEPRLVEVPDSSRVLDTGIKDIRDARTAIRNSPPVEITGNQDRDILHAPDRPICKRFPSSRGFSPSGTVSGKNPDPSILLVEDNIVNLQILIAYLKKEGWTCTTATNGLEAVQEFQAHPEKFVMIMIDISMPIMNGFEASREIRRFEREYFNANPSSKPSWYPTTIAALTGLDSADAQQEAFASGIDLFFTKPISRQKVRSLLERCNL
ncbi:hypothetical protein BJX76DRAFT_364820 [Aspergillus varians]